jgi:hypothetical protein
VERLVVRGRGGLEFPLGNVLVGKGVETVPSSLIWMMMNVFDEDFLRELGVPILRSLVWVGYRRIPFRFLRLAFVLGHLSFH